MKKEKIMLINGCSHSAGAEIDGTQDTKYNRDHSFGNLLAKRFNYKPVNISSGGSTNASIARSTLEWCLNYYNPELVELFVLISWTDSNRIEIPSPIEFYYNMANTCSDWHSKISNNFLRINPGWVGLNDYEKEVVPYYQDFISRNLTYLEIQSANLVLQLQYYFKSIQIKYVMCSSMIMFSDNDHIKFYLKLIDNLRYYDLNNFNSGFYWKYRNQGYKNPKAKYWHHNEIPHSLYCEELSNFIKDNGLI